LFFGCFIAVAGVFHYRIARYPTTRSKSLAIPWERYLRILYLASVLIMIRSVLRIVEYVMGQDGILLAHEIYLYIFDAMLMFIMMVLFNAWHPSKIIHKARADDVAHLESQDIGYALEINNERAFPKH
jgi:tellurite resistance protein TehA-like permease